MNVENSTIFKGNNFVILHEGKIQINCGKENEHGMVIKNL